MPDQLPTDGSWPAGDAFLAVLREIGERWQLERRRLEVDGERHEMGTSGIPLFMQRFRLNGLPIACLWLLALCCSGCQSAPMVKCAFIDRSTGERFYGGVYVERVTEVVRHRSAEQNVESFYLDEEATAPLPVAVDANQTLHFRSQGYRFGTVRVSGSWAYVVPPDSGPTLSRFNLAEAFLKAYRFDASRAERVPLKPDRLVEVPCIPEGRP